MRQVGDGAVRWSPNELLARDVCCSNNWSSNVLGNYLHSDALVGFARKYSRHQGLNWAVKSEQGIVSGAAPERSAARPSLHEAQHFVRSSSLLAAGFSSVGLTAVSSAAMSAPPVSLSASGTSACFGLPQANAKRARATRDAAKERDRFFMNAIRPEALSGRKEGFFVVHSSKPSRCVMLGPHACAFRWSCRDRNGCSRRVVQGQWA